MKKLLILTTSLIISGNSFAIELFPQTPPIGSQQRRQAPRRRRLVRQRARINLLSATQTTTRQRRFEADMNRTAITTNRQNNEASRQ